jgi:oligopeptide/dipeptide ABC transporter ATP-binding protein
VTIQAQIIDLLRSVQAERRMAMIFVTHDLKLVGKIADRVAVMYASQVVEEGKVTDVLANPRHPYTRALLDCIPSRRDAAGNRRTLQPIPGTMPNPLALPQGCLFSKRCRHVEPRCTEARPPLIPVSPDHVSRCIRAEELSL